MKIIDELFEEDIKQVSKIRNLHIGIAAFTMTGSGIFLASYVVSEHMPIKIAIATPFIIATIFESYNAKKQNDELKKICFTKSIVENETIDCFPEELVKEEKRKNFRIIK